MWAEDGVGYEITSSTTAKVVSLPAGERYSGSVRIKSKVSSPIGLRGTYTVTTIGSSAFGNCKELTSVYIPNTVTTIYSNAFYGCEQLTSISLPSSLESIGEGAFQCSGLITVSIPSSVVEIGEKAFAQCANLEKIIVDNDGRYCFDNKALFTKSKKTLLQVLNIATDNYVIPSTVENIAKYAFYGCDKITAVTIPTSVSSIADYAFEMCFAITNIDLPESVESLGVGCFMDCTGLKSVKLPSTINKISDRLFSGCTNLNKFSLPAFISEIGDYSFRGCPFAEISLPASTIQVGMGAFNECKNLKSVVLPMGVSYIAGYTFSGCSSLENIAIPNTVTSIGEAAFGGCSSLENITIPNTVTNIGEAAFSGCSMLKNVELNENITVIGNRAFNGCTSLKMLVIPNSVTAIGKEAFKECSLHPLAMYGRLPKSSTNYEIFTGLRKNSMVLVPQSDVQSVKKYFDGEVYPIDAQYYVYKLEPYIRGCSFDLYANPYYKDYEGSWIVDFIKIKDEIIPFDEKFRYTTVNLEPDRNYTIDIYGHRERGGDTVKLYSEPFQTLQRDVKIIFSDQNYQTKLIIDKVVAKEDVSDKADRTGVNFRGKDYDYTGEQIIFENLSPEGSYEFLPYAYYGDERLESEKVAVGTRSAALSITATKVGPTSITLKGTYLEQDATILERGFKNYDGSFIYCEGDKFERIGLIPNTEYTFRYFVSCAEGYTERKITVATTNLQLETLDPQGVSNTCSIVAAETNILEEETNAGFEWRKYDAPSSLPSSNGFGAIYEGRLEGYIKNLQPTSYYKVRAFYKSESGWMYYGDWVTFDPSDFSYFEPTVHTYPIQGLSYNSATVKGYVIAGTDEITEQGFEYWLQGAADVKRVSGTKVPSEISTILSNGQVMFATLENLEPNSDYCVRAFVTTINGTTYGEEQSFTTERDPLGICDTNIKSKVEIIGYYDINGRQYAVPQRGINIVRYSDGSVRKMIIKD